MRWQYLLSTAMARAVIKRLQQLGGKRLAAGLLCLMTGLAHADREPLTLPEAVTLAFERADPTLVRHDERAAALRHRAVASAQLPDPQVRFGLVNWPAESFDYEREPMTQIQAGIRQQFPRGNSLAIMAERKQAEATTETARRALQTRELARATRRAWLELWYLAHADDIAGQSRDAVSQLVEAVQASFATGLQSNQDLLRAELEQSLIDDRALELKRQAGLRRADLTRLIGSAAAVRPVARELPVWPGTLTAPAIDMRLVNHPAMAVEDAVIAVRGHDVELAHTQYDPGFALEAGYGARGAGRADFVSVILTVDVPLFTAKRQDQVLAASEQERTAAQFDRDAVLLSLSQQLVRAHADAERLNERIALYGRVVVKRAEEAAAAALDGYQNQVSDFAELIRARLTALDTGLKLRRLETDHGLAQAELIYLLGEE